MDDDEREIEAFKRFCFNSVPTQRKKLNINFNSNNKAAASAPSPTANNNILANGMKK